MTNYFETSLSVWAALGSWLAHVLFKSFQNLDFSFAKKVTSIF
jgi:hypothetical protein